MWSKYFVILTGILLSLGVGNFPCFGDKFDHRFPLGKIGCLFTETENLCNFGSTCIDDLLFGTCSGPGIPDDFVYTLNQHDLIKLQEEITSLVKDGFIWNDKYTQCILQNVIISLSVKEPFSKKLCYGLIFELQEPSSKTDITDILSSLYNGVNYDGISDPRQTQEQELLGNSQKRDEIVRVHKYFDKSKNIHKRLFKNPSAYDSSYLSYYPRDDIPGLDSGYYPEDYSSQNREGWEDSGVPLEDLELVVDYLDQLQQKKKQRSKLSELFLMNSQGSSYPSLEGYYDSDSPAQGYDDMVEEVPPQYLWNEEESPEEATQAMELMEQPMVEEEEEDDELANALSPELANTLDRLIKGELEPDQLSDEEITLLTPYVSTMLQRLGDLEQEVEEEIQQDDQGYPEALPDAVVETEMLNDLGGIPFGAEEEDMNLNGDSTEEEVPQTGETVNEIADDNPEMQKVLEEHFFEKKSSDGVVHKAVKKDDIVDTNFAFIQMDKQLNDDLKEKLLEALQKVVTANPGTLQRALVVGDKLKINVDPILAGVNASVVAQQASDHKEDLEKATGLKFVKSGIGSQTEVEIKPNDDRGFLLTFLLCGCIAGILLAVVVIYLIRRNTRSKEKLQQIASVQEGNEAASKDYQDLCRQRMQSKSSEKPEPLHAASRVGSVSESQVRSPSSRSSTSSWSEEPVNSNMDISTGHIVLSYMEDHLKNKDRLEREWEAMCAYEADPSSTKVAEDPSNARKNRYGDVFPYDHSRVVLSTNTNVSGSDFINASTITDHDPRNPAYIATQGPLPHTVADFWQMVWEQGSVVIVMLTKLTENGEAKCHRYWPEEGSDLYHIYEVHLVSEHIWCEDYLVRSFYLKNLQTSETRTVTQFHFLTWPDLGIPSSIKALLDFRRKVNKSYRGRSCPIVVHCSEGCGRTGTYTLIDMVLNRMSKGAKEIDIAATLEHIRDQRMNMVKTKEQFQFALAAVAEEVHAILKALPQ